jgi:hypothetical protein
LTITLSLKLFSVYNYLKFFTADSKWTLINTIECQLKVIIQQIRTLNKWTKFIK